MLYYLFLDKYVLVGVYFERLFVFFDKKMIIKIIKVFVFNVWYMYFVVLDVIIVFIKIKMFKIVVC